MVLFEGRRTDVMVDVCRGCRPRALPGNLVGQERCWQCRRGLNVLSGKRDITAIRGVWAARTTHLRRCVLFAVLWYVGMCFVYGSSYLRGIYE